MKILLEIAGLHLIGGVTTFVGELANALAAKGEEVTIGTFRQIGCEGDFKTHAAVRVAQIGQIEQERFDVVHVNGMWDRDVYWASGWALKRKIPLVWSPHGMLAPWALKHHWWKKFAPWHLYLHRRLKRAAAIHVTSDLERQWVEALRLGPVVTVPLGTHLPKEAVAKRRQGPLEVLFVGRIHPVKGLMNLVKAAALLPRDVARFRIVGSDDIGYQKTLLDAAAECGVQNAFDFVGPKYGQELSAEYDRCDLLVLPSQSENFGGVVVDALAHGRPVIASNKTPWQGLEENRCGWWVDNSPESLAQTLMAINASADLPAMGARGREWARREFSWESVAVKMKAAYEWLVNPEVVEKPEWVFMMK